MLEVEPSGNDQNSNRAIAGNACAALQRCATLGCSDYIFNSIRLRA